MQLIREPDLRSQLLKPDALGQHMRHRAQRAFTDPVVRLLPEVDALQVHVGGGHGIRVPGIGAGTVSAGCGDGATAAALPDVR